MGGEWKVEKSRSFNRTRIEMFYIYYSAYRVSYGRDFPFPLSVDKTLVESELKDFVRNIYRKYNLSWDERSEGMEKAEEFVRTL